LHADDILAEIPDCATPTYHLTNVLGSVHRLTDLNGVVMSRTRAE
jgi:hypothetical protein